jgi:hypothetical protein
MTDTPTFTLPTGLPAGPWTTAINPNHIIMDASGYVIAATWGVPNEPLARAIASIPDMVKEIERLRAKVKLAFVQEIVNENESLRAENAEMRRILNTAAAEVSEIRGILYRAAGILEEGEKG